MYNRKQNVTIDQLSNPVGCKLSLCAEQSGKQPQFAVHQLAPDYFDTDD